MVERNLMGTLESSVDSAGVNKTTFNLTTNQHVKNSSDADLYLSLEIPGMGKGVFVVCFA